MSDTIFSLSKKDILGGKVYPPAWYTVEINDLNVAPSKNVETPSTNFEYTTTILQDADTGDATYAEHPLKILFNSRALGFTKGFLVALGVPEENITEDKRFDFKAAIGKKIDVFVENGQWEGRLVNRVNHKYRPTRVA